MVTSCNKEVGEPSDFEGSVLIIGAGAAGMASGYLLAQKGIDFQILEASNTYGGRMKRTKSFVDFPISLGAEWLHIAESELANIVNDASIQVSTQFQAYQSQAPIGCYKNGSLSYSTLEEEFGSDFIDKKFINSTWLDFFEEYIVPSIASKMSFNTQITSIDYQEDTIYLTDNNGQIHSSDKVIVTVPLKILQEEDIAFTPQLPSSHTNAIQDAPIWGGIKVFLEFSEKFYPPYLTFADSETSTGQRFYYDAAFGQNSSTHVLGFVALGQQAIPYQERTGDSQKDYILNELDAIFNGMASLKYSKHIVQNWDTEPYIRSAYLSDFAASNISNRLSKNVENKVYFAGEAYTDNEDWGGVHNATHSARKVIEEFA